VIRNRTLPSFARYFSEEVPRAVFPALLDASARRPNVTVLTMSLPAFCKAASCHPNDFVAAHSKHPSARGYASFADLFVCDSI
jgi:hypothetical protein